MKKLVFESLSILLICGYMLWVFYLYKTESSFDFSFFRFNFSTEVNSVTLRTHFLPLAIVIGLVLRWVDKVFFKIYK